MDEPLTTPVLSGVYSMLFQEWYVDLVAIWCKKRQKESKTAKGIGFGMVFFGGLRF
jgi:hypothetical protein